MDELTPICHVQAGVVGTIGQLCLTEAYDLCAEVNGHAFHSGHQFQTHPDITLEDTQLQLERSPKILGVIMDPSLFFHKH